MNYSDALKRLMVGEYRVSFLPTQVRTRRKLRPTYTGPVLISQNHGQSRRKYSSFFCSVSPQEDPT